MFKRRLNSSGFSTVIIAIGLLVVVAITVSGVLVYRHSHNKKLASMATATNASTSPTTQTSGTSQPTAQQYLVIKEWGIQMPLSDAIKDAYYIIPNGVSNDADGRPSAIALGITSLNASCGVVSSNTPGYGNALGAVVRSLPTDSDPITGRPYSEKFPNGTTIAGYYYGYSSRTSGKNCASLSTLQSIDSAFTSAAKSIVGTP